MKASLASSMALTQIGEPPDISQSDTKPHTGQHVLGLVVPFWSASCFFFLQFVQLLMGHYPVLQARIVYLQPHDPSNWYCSDTAVQC